MHRRSLESIPKTPGHDDTGNEEERSLFLSRTFEESQPDLRVRLRLEVKDSNQGSQSTRGVIGLEISGLFARPPSSAIAYPNAEIINAATERERKA